MKLIVQPRDGLTSLIAAIHRAQHAIDIVIFRFDLKPMERALATAITRGVRVRALIAHTNRRGEKRLRLLEQSLLAAGVTVTRTGDDFVRYHGKMMVIDRRTLWVCGFNWTGLDISQSRSFGIVTGGHAEVQQALTLFEADSTRQPYAPARGRLVVSPEDSRTVLEDFIAQAKRQLLIYDPKIGDRAMIKALRDRLTHGVDVRIIGKVARGASEVPHERYPGKRLHVRAIIRDGHDAFVGSQSLRALELDKRREVGVLLREGRIVRELVTTFERDWALTESGQRPSPVTHTTAAAVPA